MEFPLPRYKKGLRPIRSSPVDRDMLDRDILRESDFTSARLAPITKGKNTFAFTVEFAALNKPKIGARDKRCYRPRLGEAWPCGARRDRRNMCKASYLLISHECKQLPRMHPRKARFRR
jgi:hypothetical protein